MIIEDPDEKKELDKIPNVDEDGEPIYKIDSSISGEVTLQGLPAFMRGTADAPQGNAQDIKDSTSED